MAEVDFPVRPSFVTSKVNCSLAPEIGVEREPEEDGVSVRSVVTPLLTVLEILRVSGRNGEPLLLTEKAMAVCIALTSGVTEKPKIIGKTVS